MSVLLHLWQHCIPPPLSGSYLKVETFTLSFQITSVQDYLARKPVLSSLKSIMPLQLSEGATSQQNVAKAGASFVVQSDKRTTISK